MTINPELQEGCGGAVVRQLQVLLCAHGCTSLMVDGMFGTATTAAVTQFQQKRGFNATGIVKQEVWEALRQLAPSETSQPPILQLGDSGEAVCQLQTLLRSHYANVVVHGWVDAKTTELVKKFQTKFGLEQTGTVDKETWRLLRSKLLSPGDSSEKVEVLQARLREHGYNLSVDGMFNAETTAAVMDFQQQHGLPIDGLVGLMTWVVLVEAAPLPAHPVQLAEVCQYYNPAHPEQIEALKWLQTQLPTATLNEFTKRWCNS